MSLIRFFFFFFFFRHDQEIWNWSPLSVRTESRRCLQITGWITWKSKWQPSNDREFLQSKTTGKGHFHQYTIFRLIYQKLKNWKIEKQKTFDYYLFTYTTHYTIHIQKHLLNILILIIIENRANSKNMQRLNVKSDEEVNFSDDNVQFSFNT